jgi:hypothetical protein
MLLNLFSNQEPHRVARRDETLQPDNVDVFVACRALSFNTIQTNPDRGRNDNNTNHLEPPHSRRFQQSARIWFGTRGSEVAKFGISQRSVDRGRAVASAASRGTDRIWVQKKCNKTYRRLLWTPKRAIGAVGCQIVIVGATTVTADAVGSSPVVPAIRFKRLRSGTFEIWVQLRCNCLAAIFPW